MWGSKSLVCPGGSISKIWPHNCQPWPTHPPPLSQTFSESPHPWTGLFFFLGAATKFLLLQNMGWNNWTSRNVKHGMGQLSFSYYKTWDGYPWPSGTVKSIHWEPKPACSLTLIVGTPLLEHSRGSSKSVGSMGTM
jgi:hypothetical protein